VDFVLNRSDFILKKNLSKAFFGALSFSPPL